MTREHLVDLPDAGHGSLLATLPPGITGLAGEMLNDPLGFNRSAATEAVNRKITAFFSKNLLR